jgi:hypothetical protein
MIDTNLKRPWCPLPLTASCALRSSAGIDYLQCKPGGLNESPVNVSPGTGLLSRATEK